VLKHILLIYRVAGPWNETSNPGGPKIGTPILICDNFRKYTPILTIFSLLEQATYGVILRLPPHFYFVTTLPSKAQLSAHCRYIISMRFEYVTF